MSGVVTHLLLPLTLYVILLIGYRLGRPVPRRWEYVILLLAAYALARLLV